MVLLQMGVDTHPASVSRCCKPQSCLSSSLSQQFCISETASNSTCRRREGKPLWTTKKTLSIELKSIPSGYINTEGWRSMFFCPGSNLAEHGAQISGCHHTLSNTAEPQNQPKEVQKVFPATFQYGTPSRQERIHRDFGKPRGRARENPQWNCLDLVFVEKICSQVNLTHNGVFTREEKAAWQKGREYRQNYLS